jgi:hypothetical protein
MALRSEELCLSSPARAVAAWRSVVAADGVGVGVPVLLGVADAAADCPVPEGLAGSWVEFTAFEPLAEGVPEWLNGCSTST